MAEGLLHNVGEGMQIAHGDGQKARASGQNVGAALPIGQGVVQIAKVVL